MGIGIRLQRLRNEDFIWLIYFFIVIAALISDSYERDFLLYKDFKKEKEFKTINITILVVAFFIYLYFVLINYENINMFKNVASNKDKLVNEVALIASLLFLVGGILYIWAEINRESSIEDLGII